MNKTHIPQPAPFSCAEAMESMPSAMSGQCTVHSCSSTDPHNRSPPAPPITRRARAFTLRGEDRQLVKPIVCMHTRADLPHLRNHPPSRELFHGHARQLALHQRGQGSVSPLALPSRRLLHWRGCPPLHRPFLRCRSRLGVRVGGAAPGVERRERALLEGFLFTVEFTESAPHWEDDARRSNAAYTYMFVFEGTHSPGTTCARSCRSSSWAPCAV